MLQSNVVFSVIWYRTGLATSVPFEKATANAFEEYVEFASQSLGAQGAWDWLDPIVDNVIETINETLVKPRCVYGLVLCF